MSGCKRISAPRALILFAGLVLAITVRAPVAWGAEPFSVERADLNPADLPQSTVAALNGHGTRIFTYVNGLKMTRKRLLHNRIRRVRLVRPMLT